MAHYRNLSFLSRDALSFFVDSIYINYFHIYYSRFITNTSSYLFNEARRLSKYIK